MAIHARVAEEGFETCVDIGRATDTDCAMPMIK